MRTRESAASPGTTIWSTTTEPMDRGLQPAVSAVLNCGEIPMTDQDNLRDRIKRLVDETDDGDSAAQAIIDEFGLTVEECPCVFDCKETRVVGKWEKQ